LDSYLEICSDIQGFDELAESIRTQSPKLRFSAQLSKLIPTDVLSPFMPICNTCFTKKQLKFTERPLTHAHWIGDHKPYHTAEAEPIFGCKSANKLSRCTKNPDRLRLMLGIDVKAAGDDEKEVIHTIQDPAGLVLALLCQRTFLQANARKRNHGKAAKTAVNAFLSKRRRVD